MKSRFKAFYIIYYAIDGNMKIKYIGSRSVAQDIVRDLITNSCRVLTPQDFILKEFITADGIVISEKVIDI